MGNVRACSSGNGCIANRCLQGISHFWKGREVPFICLTFCCYRGHRHKEKSVTFLRDCHPRTQIHQQAGYWSTGNLRLKQRSASLCIAMPFSSDGIYLLYHNGSPFPTCWFRTHHPLCKERYCGQVVETRREKFWHMPPEEIFYIRLNPSAYIIRVPGEVGEPKFSYTLTEAWGVSV